MASAWTGPQGVHRADVVCTWDGSRQGPMPRRTGAAAQPRGGGEVTSKTPAQSTPWLWGDGFPRSRVHLTRGPGPQGRRHMGPTSRVHPQPPARARRETEEARPDGAGALPDGTGHLRRRPAYRSAQEAMPHPPVGGTVSPRHRAEQGTGRGGRG